MPYALIGRHDAAEASRFAIGLTEPLLAVRAPTSEPHADLLPAGRRRGRLALALKPSEDGQAWIVRLFGASGEARQAKLTWSFRHRENMAQQS